MFETDENFLKIAIRVQTVTGNDGIIYPSEVTQYDVIIAWVNYLVDEEPERESHIVLNKILNEEPPKHASKEAI